MDRNGADALPPHGLQVPTAQSFGMSEPASAHYHAVDALSSNVLSSGRERLTPPEPPSKPASTKRRKINTCFPCKQRKVKCDRQQPYCGQCQKHRIPAERCIWSSDVALSNDMHSAASSALSYAKPDSSHASLGLGAGDWSSSQAQDLGLDSDTRAVIERISHLEQRLSTNTASQPSSHELPTNSSSQTQIDPILLAGTGLSLNDVNGDRSSAASLSQDAAVAAELAFWRAKMEQQQRPSHAGDSTQMAQMQAEQNIAADALAMFARHSQPGGLSGSGDAALPRSAAVAHADGMPRPTIVNALLDSAAFGMTSASSRVRAALDLLPDTQPMDYLLKILQTVDLHVSYGISWRLVRTQLVTLRAQLARWNRLHTAVPEQLDVSFLALLLVLLGMAAQYTESRFFLEQGFCSSADQIEPLVDNWVDHAQALLAADDPVTKTNWNHLAALLLCVDHHASRGRLLVSLVTLTTLVRLAEQQGYHTLGSATDDEQAWLKAPDSEQVSLSAVAAAPRPGAWVRPTCAATTLPARSHLVREAARRIWYKIACKDMVVSAVVPRVAPLDPARATTAPPLNVDEDDLPDGDVFALPRIKADGKPTINNLTPYMFQIANLGREWGALSQSGALTYAHVLEFDAKFRGLLSSLPVYLRPDPALEQLPEVRQEQAQRPYLAMHRLIVFEAVNHRLLVLHRDFMCQGHEDDKYAYSTRVAVDAARTIISCRQQIDNVHPSVQRHAAFRHHLFQAAVVLTLHLWQLSGKTQGTSQVAHQLREDIALIMDYLKGPSGEVPPTLPTSQKIALQLLDTLLGAASARIVKIDADASGGGADSAHDDRGSASTSSAAGATVSMAMAGDSSSQLFQLPAATNEAAAPLSPHLVADTAASLAKDMMDPEFANKPSLTQFFASLDELMVPMY